MPGMNGIEFLTKAGRSLRSSVRIMLTGPAEFTNRHGAAVQIRQYLSFFAQALPRLSSQKVLEAGLGAATA